MSKSKGTYFKNLDSLRFFAALCVILGHCQEHVFQMQGIKVYEPYVNKAASFGVDFFFTLSGFLISYILMSELKTTGTIQVKNFFIRRFLRIWPLYFLFGLIYILGGVSYWIGYAPAWQTLKEALYNVGHLATFTTNFQILLGTANYYTPAHFWSLSVEEQYYFLWLPLLLVFRKQIWIVILVFIAVAYHYNSHTTMPFSDIFYNESMGDYSPYFFTVNHFYHFAMGASLAWVLHFIDFEKLKNRIIDSINWLDKKCNTTQITPSPLESSWTVLAVVQNKNVQIIASVGIQLCFLIPWLIYLFGAHYPDNHDQTTPNGYISLGIILFAIMRYTVLKLENPILKYGGTISFGIYVFHFVGIRLAHNLMVKLGFVQISEAYYIWLPIFSTALSVIMAAISYELVEKRFLKLKSRFR